MLKKWRMTLNSNKGSWMMLRARLHNFKLKLRLDKLTWRKSRIWKAVLTKKWSNTVNRLRKWKMKWQTNSQRLTSLKPPSIKKSKDLLWSKSLSSNTSMACLNSLLITQCVMIQRRIWFYKMKSTTSSMKLRRSSLWTSLRYTLFSNTSRLKELSQTIKPSSKSVSHLERI